MQWWLCIAVVLLIATSSRMSILLSLIHRTIRTLIQFTTSLFRGLTSALWVIYFRVVVTILKFTQPELKISKKTANELNTSYDAIILGSGFCGNILGTVLSSVGMSVLIVDVVDHPRAVIGESTVPKTTININRLASEFAIPELCDLTKYAFVNVTKFRKFPKAYFSFYNCKNSDKRNCIVMPVGDPDTHVKREVLDSYLASVASKYGCHQYVGAYNFVPETESISINGRNVDCSFIFDATGRRKFMSDYVSQGDVTEATLDTRAFWFRLRYDELDFDCMESEFVNKDSLKSYWASTHHLIMDEGWIWLIPLDHNEISVGFVLRTELSSTNFSDNINNIYSRYPKIARLFKQALFTQKNMVKREHLQSICNKMRRGKVILTPFSMGFNDPLFSNGLTLISSWVWRVGQIFKGYKPQCEKGLQPYVTSYVNSSIDTFGECVREGLKHNDMLIKSIYMSFPIWEKFCHSLVLWQVATTFYELSDQHDQNTLDFFGAGNDWLRQCCSRVSKGEAFTDLDMKYMYKFMAEGRFESSAQAIDQIHAGDETVYLYDLGFYLLKFFYTRDLDYKIRTIFDSLLFWKTDYRYHNWLLRTVGSDPRKYFTFVSDKKNV